MMDTGLAIKLSTTDGWLLFVCTADADTYTNRLEQAQAVANTLVGAIETISPIPVEWVEKMRAANELEQQWSNTAPDLYSVTNETRENFIAEFIA